MKYSDIELNTGFVGNMRDTAWKKLFPYWYAEDAFIASVGTEIALLKAQGIFALLNIGLKPPVMVWQKSLDHKAYVSNATLTELPASIELPAPFYKTWGTISIKNNGNEDISDLKIMFNNVDGVLIQNNIPIDGTLFIDLENQNYYINSKKIKPFKYGKGLSHFITSRNNEQYVKDTPFHNEIIRMTFSSFLEEEVNMEVTTTLNNVVFENEQNIEITSLELLPIEKVVMYSYFDLPFREEVNGWKKTYEKKYADKSTVIYDMITTHIFTKKFYVDVWFKALDYPYRVGFPCYKDAPQDSSFHINTELDSMGEILGLPRREYKQNIPEEDYPYTFPEFYPFDIEQDYWYYSRLVNEYTYNDLAIDTVDIKDTEDNNVVRLHSINPFVEDFVVTAQSRYPSEIESVDYHDYTPSIVWQHSESAKYNQADHHYIENLLKKDDNYTFTIMQGKDNNNISYETYKSKTLGMWFDLTNLPSDVNIDGIELILDGESTDNSSEKYVDERSILRINADILGIPMFADDHFQLKRKNITLGDKDSISYFKHINNTSARIYQEITIHAFSGRAGEYYEIPFIYKENDEIIDNINDVGVLYYNENDECLGFSKSYYYIETRDDRIHRYLRTLMPNIEDVSHIVLISTTDDYHPFSIKMNVKVESIHHNDANYYKLSGPYENNEAKPYIVINDEWDNGDLKNMLQKNGLYYDYGLTNDNESASSTVLLHNATLRIYHSPKTSQFRMETRINHSNLVAPNIGTLEVTITNTGERDLKTNVDIICVENLKLSQNFIDVDLDIGESLTTLIDIQPEYNIVDGVYEIITVCEDITETDYIYVDTKGLIKTGIDILPHFGRYDTVIPLTASVYNENGTLMDGEPHKIAFYIDDFYVGEGNVINGTAHFDLIPERYRFIEAGNYKLTAKYVGSEKYAISRRNTNIFINKNNLNLMVEASDTAVWGQEYPIKAIVTNENGEPINEGTITILIDDNPVATKEVSNGEMIYNLITNDFKPNEHTLTVRYNNTATYPQTEVSQPVVIIGGKTNVMVFDTVAKPSDEVKIRAKVSDVNGRAVPIGYIDFEIYDNEELMATYADVPISNGIASIYYEVPANALADINKKVYEVRAHYHNDGIYQGDDGIGNITVERRNVIIESADIFYGSKYEPLGFYAKIVDAENGEPVTDGRVTVEVIGEDIEVTVDVDEDGGARLIYNPVTFSAKEWRELERTIFSIENTAEELDEYGNLLVQATVVRENDEIVSVSDVDMAENAELYRIYDGTEPYQDLNLTKFFIDELGHLWYDTQNDAYEHIWIDDNGHLYARTALDIKRQYPTGRYMIEISYNSDVQYVSNRKDALLEINEPAIDVDMHSYDLHYDDDLNINAYVTQYTWDDEDTVWINDGQINFFLDDVCIDTVQVNNGLGYIPYTELNNIQKGRHLLTAEYISDVNTYTYVLLDMHQIKPTLDYSIDRVFKGKNSKVNVQVNVQNDFEVTGNVSAYLNGDIIDNIYLYGSEGGKCTFKVAIPNDADIKEYVLTLSYGGNNNIEPISVDIPLVVEPLTVDVQYDEINITPSTKYNIYIDVSARDNDDISEGQIFIRDLNNRTLTSALVVNNKAILTLTSPEEIGSYQYLVYYENGTNYIGNESGYIVNVNVIEAIDTIYVVGDVYNWEADEKNTRFAMGEVLFQEVYDGDELLGYVFDDLEEALNIISDNGTIYIVDDIKIAYDTHINKPVNIIGYNNAEIIKDAPDLIFEKGDVKIYYEDDFNDFSELFEIEELEASKLNTIDYRIIDNEIYYIDGKRLVQLYLLNTGKIYSYSTFLPQTTALYIENDVYVENIHFINNDPEDGFNIVNNGSLKIVHSVLDKDIKIINRNDLTINRSLVYCDIQTNEADLDNNWWGKNSAPFDVNNNIILTMSADKEPAVIGEDFEVTIQLIGANGRKYSIPNPDFILTSDTGYFQIDNGTFVDNKMVTEFIDATQEGKLYASVDNEIVSIDVYEYERKTEVILEPAKEIPIGYNIKLKAIVQSCAEVSYYLNEGKLKTVDPVNNGYVIFYVNDMEIGRANVMDSVAELDTYFNNGFYNTEDIYDMRAVYVPREYYFGSESQKTFKLIDDDVCFVSPSGNDLFYGTFESPFRTIQKALESGKTKIFLKEGNYDEENIAIDRNVTIKQYNGSATFRDKDIDGYVFIINEDAQLNIYGIDFVGNKCSALFKNYNNLFIEECIFHDNECTLVDNSENNTTSIRRSAIVNNYDITATGDIEALEYCWFGTNYPESVIEMPVNDFIVMTVESSKDVIYIGTVAHIRAKLNHFSKNGIIFELQDELPLRIAYFLTDFGTMRPMKDYTHNKQATSLLNTNENPIPYYIDAHMTNRIYVGQPVNLEFYAQYIQNDKGFDGIGYCQVEQGENRIIDATPIRFIDGYGVLDGHGLMLDADEYTYNLTLTSDKTYTFRESFKVSQPDIVLKNIQIDEGDHLYHLDIYADVEDEVGNKIMNQQVKFFIDDEPIYFGKTTKYSIQNGILNAKLNYTNIKAGNHTLRITTDGIISNYNTFEYEMNFKSYEKTTQIAFEYDKLQKGSKNDLVIEVKDDEGKVVPSGSIIMTINDAQVYIDENNNFVSYETDFDNIRVKNGLGMLNNFVINENGQYSIVLYYSGVNGYYKEAIAINNEFNVGLYNVIIDSQELKEQLNKEIGEELKLKFGIRDINNNPVEIGKVNFYLDGILLNPTPIDVTKMIEFRNSLSQTPAGVHNFRIEYIDESDTYLDTTLTTKLNIGKIKNTIDIDTIFARPNATAYVPYTITSQYGRVGTGELVAYLDGNEIGRTNVSSLYESTIPLNIPLILANGDYTIHFEYRDYGNAFEENEVDVKLEIVKDIVNIDISHEWYYPNKEFNLVINVTDINGLPVDTGEVGLFIDNMQEGERQSCGSNIQYRLSFKQSRIYPMTVIYYENDYYAQTTKQQDFRVNNIPIVDINFTESLQGKPNEKINTELVFTTNENYNVSDGMIDFLFDGKLMNRYSVPEAHKMFDLDLPDTGFGEHFITIKYYNSYLFEDFTKEKIPIQINKRDVELTVDEEITADANAQITIRSEIYPKLDGMLKYYMGINEDSLKVIGIKEIKSNEIEFTYTLPNTLDSDEYLIRVVYEGNGQYNAISQDCMLHINKTTPTLAVNDIEAGFGETIFIELDSNINENARIELYMNDMNIGFATLMNGEAKYEYDLQNIHIAGEYELKAIFNGSAIYESAEAVGTITINPYRPDFNDTPIEVNIGGIIPLGNELLDANGFKIKTGHMTYDINGVSKNAYPNAPIEQPMVSDEEFVIHMSYESDEPDKYASFEVDIDVIPIKNDIDIRIDNFGMIHRGVPFIEHITLTADTIFPVNVDVIGLHQDAELNRGTAENGETELELIFSPLLPDARNYRLTIATVENDIFNACEQEFVIINENYDSIYVSDAGSDENDGSSEYPVKTLKTAINLVKEGGDIHIVDSVNNESVVIDKPISLIGNECNEVMIDANQPIDISGIDFHNSQVVNNERAIIKNCTFDGNDDSAIINNAEMYVDNCTFTNNSATYGGAIYINSQNRTTEITNCTFTQNNALLYGGAIHLNKGNDVSIVNNAFYDGNVANQHGSSISVNGNAYLKDNMFYGNMGHCEVYLMNGSIEAETNLFDGERIALHRFNGNVTANLNYWGYNNIEDIEMVVLGRISFDTWLLSDWKVNNYPFVNDEEYTITPVIDKYANRNEVEVNEYKVKNNFPVKINDTDGMLDDGYTFTYTEPIILTIGSQIFTIKPRNEEFWEVEI